MISRALEDSILDMLATFGQSRQNPDHVAFDVDEIYRCHDEHGAVRVFEAIQLLVAEHSIEWHELPGDKTRASLKEELEADTRAPLGRSGRRLGLRITKSGLRFVVPS